MSSHVFPCSLQYTTKIVFANDIYRRFLLKLLVMIFTNGLLYGPSIKNGSIFTSGFIIQGVGGNQIYFYRWFVQQVVGENMCLSLFNLRVLLESG